MLGGCVMKRAHNWVCEGVHSLVKIMLEEWYLCLGDWVFGGSGRCMMKRVHNWVEEGI